MAVQLVIGAVTILSSAYSGFDEEQSKSRVRLLSDGLTTRNEVIQQGSSPMREASVAFVVESDDADTIQGYYENATEVTFTDYEDIGRTVIVYDYSRSLIVNGLYSVTVTLLETAILGS